ncbi:MAG: hypothetical protein EZS28_040215, partial [Streblomastix strix]
GIKMDLKPETNQEAEAKEHIEEGNMVIKEGDRTIRIEINRIRRDIEKRKRENWDDNPNDEWIKRTQMQKDTSENHSDKDSTWTEDEAPQNQITTSQPKQPVHQTQRVQQVQVQPKQQAPAQVPRQRNATREVIYTIERETIIWNIQLGE